MKTMKLIEFMEFSDNYGFDITDDIWDWGNYFETPRNFKECENDYYNLLMWHFANNIEIVKYQEDWYSICKVSEFIYKNIKAFNKFMNEENREGYRPNEYEEIESADDGLMVDIYLPTFENLINGNYSDDGYKKICEYLINYL